MKINRDKTLIKRTSVRLCF